MATIPQEYFLPLLKEDNNGVIIGTRQLPSKLAAQLFHLSLLPTQLKKSRKQHLDGVALLHQVLTSRFKGEVNRAQARCRQAKHRGNLNLYKSLIQERDYFQEQMKCRQLAFTNQERQAKNWDPPYYLDGRFDVIALRHRLKSQLHLFLPTTVTETYWVNPSNQIESVSPQNPTQLELPSKQHSSITTFALELYGAFLYWCMPKRKEATCFSKLSDLHRHQRLRYLKQAEELTVGILNHALPGLFYTNSDVRYLISPTNPKISQSKRYLPDDEIPSLPPSHQPLQDITQTREYAQALAMFR